MNVFEGLAQSAKNNHGRTLQPPQVQELVGVLQQMQLQISNDMTRMDALTRILAVAIHSAGGTLDIEPDTFGDAENWLTDVVWDEEEDGGTIHVTTRLAIVDVPTVQDDDQATGDSDIVLVPVSEDTGDSGGGDASLDGPIDSDEA